MRDTIRRMSRQKNKPKKGAAAVSPAQVDTGKTEVIVPVTSTTVAATTPLPTFTQIGMAGMIGMLGSATAATAATTETIPSIPEQTVTEPATTQISAETVTPATEPIPSETTPLKEAVPKEEAAEEKSSEPKEQVTTPAIPVTTQPTGFYGYIKSFFNTLGGAIHR